MRSWERLERVEKVDFIEIRTTWSRVSSRKFEMSVQREFREKQKIRGSRVFVLVGNELKNVRNIGKTFKGSQSLSISTWKQSVGRGW